MKYSKTTLMELSHKYSSILRKCALLNAVILFSSAIALPAGANTITGTVTEKINVDVGETQTISDAIATGLENTGDGAVIYNEGTVTAKNTTFTGNEARYGGAIENYGANANLTINQSVFSTNNAYGGGAIDNDGNAELTINAGTQFTSNSADTYGGAISNWSGTVNVIGTKENKVVFSQNESAFDGGAIFNSDNLKVNFAEFKANSSTDDEDAWGGAIANGGILSINNSTFDGNSAKIAGAIIDYLDSTGGVSVGGTIENTVFKNNFAEEIGAVGLYTKYAKSSFKNVEFIKNNATSSAADSDGSGAIFIGAEAGVVITNSKFDQNISAAGAGAIGSRSFKLGSNNVATLDIIDSEFTNNTAATNGGAISNYLYNDSNNDGYVKISGSTFKANTAANGGAIYNHIGKDGDKLANNEKQVGNIYLSDSSFTNNVATTTGGAIYNEGIITFAGTNTFSGNTASSNANDIYNAGTLNISGILALDGGVINTDDGIINFASGSQLKAALNNSTALISGGITNGTTALVIENGTANATFKLFDVQQQEFVLTNSLYTITDNADGSYGVSKKSSAEVVSELSKEGVNSQAAGIISAVADSKANNPVLATITEAVQTGNVTGAAEAAEDLAPTTSQAVMGVTQGVNTLLSNLATGRMASLGRAGGDTFIGGSTWVQGLYNHTKQDKDTRTDGFKANTRGIALGVDGKINEAVTIGVGYGYTNTQAKAGGRKIDVNGNNIFVYAQYQPNSWYINSMFNYGFAKYTEKKAPMGIAMKAKYDVNTFAANVMTGYEFESGFTPEIGLRYILADQKAYDDGIQRISSDNNDVLTGVIGIKYTANLKTEDWTFKPTLGLAATYDVISDNSKANVDIIGGGNYQILGERLHRFGVETNVGIGATYGDWDLSVDYNGGFRKDFQSHTGIMKAKYNF